MAANYGTNPSNPVNQEGGQMPSGQDQLLPPMQRDPSSIRDYLAMARKAGTAPAFTNKPGGEGMFMPEPEPQAIPEGPQSQYEKLRFSERMKINPYMRAQERVQSMLPQMWQSMFPGMEQGSVLQDYEMQQWQGAVEKLTGNLLKHFDKQYEWSLKNESSNKLSLEKDRRFWQSKFVDAKLRNQPPMNEETGMPLTEEEFISERMSVSDEMRFKSEVGAEENASNATAGISGMDSAQIGEILRKNPDLMKNIKYDVLIAVSEQAGRNVSEDELNGMAGSPELDRITLEVLQKYESSILELQ